jgi:single-strand DNA-binding protein
MNSVHLVGKIASDIRVQEFTGKTKASFLLAVPRPVRDSEPDFVRCETWGKQAENLVKFNQKGSRIAVTGHLRSRFYNPDGGTKGGQLMAAVVAEEIVYLQSRRPGAAENSATTQESAAATRKGAAR